MQHGRKKEARVGVDSRWASVEGFNRAEHTGNGSQDLWRRMRDGRSGQESNERDS